MPAFPEFYVAGNVGASHSQPNDVKRIQNVMDETGYGSAPPVPSGRYDQSTHDNIVGFQDDFGLKQDGFLAPGGPTELAMTLAIDANRAGGSEGLEAFREPYASFNQDGFKYMPDPNYRWERPRSWVAPDGRKITDAQRDAVLVSKQRGNQIKHLPFNDPTVSFERPNPVASLARDVFGEHAIAAPPGSDWYARGENPKAESARMQIARATSAPTKISEAESEVESWNPNQDFPDDQNGSNDDNKESRPDQESKPEGKPEKDESEDKKIEWEPGKNIFNGERTIKVKGPIKLEFCSDVLLVDGLNYGVNWMPLDKDG